MKVLIAIDCSPASQGLISEAVARPWAARSSFCVVSAVDIARFAKLPALVEDAKRASEKAVQAAAEQIKRAGREATSEVVFGSPRHAVSAYAAEWGADLILLGSHGDSAVGRFLIGSVALGILRKATCSVEIVRTRSKAPSPSHPMKILVATDGSECSLFAARSIANRPWPSGAVFEILSVEELVLVPTPVTVSSPAAFYPSSLLEEILAESRLRASEATESAKKILTEAALHVAVPRPTPAGDPRSIILDVAKTWEADLIVLGSHGRSGLDRFLMGSVSEAVAVHADCSVEIIRATPMTHN